MASVHLYVPDSLFNRRDELSPEETLSQIFNEAFERRLNDDRECDHSVLRCASCGRHFDDDEEDSPLRT